MTPDEREGIDRLNRTVLECIGSARKSSRDYPPIVRVYDTFWIPGPTGGWVRGTGDKRHYVSTACDLRSLAHELVVFYTLTDEHCPPKTPCPAITYQCGDLVARVWAPQFPPPEWCVAVPKPKR